ncbi:MAG: flagellar basal body P-ring protein FlgI, partial [Luminiphilus sp.]
EELEVEPGRSPAKVVINSRTGTVVINQSVKVSAAAVSHGVVSVSIATLNEISQPEAFSPGGQTAGVSNSVIAIEEPTNETQLIEDSVDLREVVEAINESGASTTSLIAILEALKSAGSLRAELVVI